MNLPVPVNNVYKQVGSWATPCVEAVLSAHAKDHLILGHFLVNKCASENHTKAQYS